MQARTMSLKERQEIEKLARAKLLEEQEEKINKKIEEILEYLKFIF